MLTGLSGAAARERNGVNGNARAAAASADFLRTLRRETGVC
jgi:hypothetical protein